ALLAGSGAAQVVDWVALEGGDAVDPAASMSHVVADAEGNAYFVGSSSTAGQFFDFAVRSFDPAGQLRWSATQDGRGRTIDTPTAVALGPGGRLVVTGVARPNSYTDFLTVAWDTSGNKLWARTKSS